MGSSNMSTVDIQNGFNMVGDLIGIIDSTKSGTTIDNSGANEERAKMKELDAREQAMAEKRQARNTARGMHEENEQGRSARNAEWGGSGLAMGGSAELVRDGRKLKDKQAEDDILFEGDAQARKAMDNGMRSANLFRIETGIAPAKSTLSLGSTLYNKRR